MRGVVLLAVLAAATPASAATKASALPDVTASTMDGKRFSLADSARGHRLVVVLFLSTVCPYANFFAGHIRDLAETYGDHGVLFVGVNSNQYEDEDEIREHARANGHSFALIRDEGARIADVFGASRTPEAFLYAADGRLLYRGWVKSKVHSPDLQQAIDASLANRKVRRASTKAFGCAIDRPRS